jgi:hypothetical protein
MFSLSLGKTKERQKNYIIVPMKYKQNKDGGNYEEE